MEQAFSGPHLWVLLVAVLYLILVIASVVRAIRLDRLSVLAKVIWSVLLVVFPIGGLVVFWAANPPKLKKHHKAPRSADS